MAYSTLLNWTLQNEAADNRLINDGISRPRLNTGLLMLQCTTESYTQERRNHKGRITPSSVPEPGAAGRNSTTLRPRSILMTDRCPSSAKPYETELYWTKLELNESSLHINDGRSHPLVHSALGWHTMRSWTLLTYNQWRVMYSSSTWTSLIEPYMTLQHWINDGRLSIACWTLPDQTQHCVTKISIAKQKISQAEYTKVYLCTAMISNESILFLTTAEWTLRYDAKGDFTRRSDTKRYDD